jgi:hypothetical protein
MYKSGRPTLGSSFSRARWAECVCRGGCAWCESTSLMDLWRSCEHECGVMKTPNVGEFGEGTHVPWVMLPFVSSLKTTLRK